MNLYDVDYNLTVTVNNKDHDLSKYLLGFETNFQVNQPPSIVLQLMGPGGIDDLDILPFFQNGTECKMTVRYTDPAIDVDIDTTFEGWEVAGFYPLEADNILNVHLVSKLQPLLDYGIFSPYYAPGTLSPAVDISDSLGVIKNIPVSGEYNVGKLIINALNHFRDLVYTGKVPGGTVVGLKKLKDSYIKNMPVMNQRLQDAINSLKVMTDLTPIDISRLHPGFLALTKAIMKGSTNASFWSILMNLCKNMNLVVIPTNGNEAHIMPLHNIQQAYYSDNDEVIEDYTNVSHLARPYQAAPRGLKQMRIITFHRYYHAKKTTYIANIIMTIPLSTDPYGTTIDVQVPPMLQRLLGVILDAPVSPKKDVKQKTSVFDPKVSDIIKSYFTAAGLARMYDRTALLELPFSLSIAPGQIVSFPITVYPKNIKANSTPTYENIYGIVSRVVTTATRTKVFTTIALTNVQAEHEANSVDKSAFSSKVLNGFHPFYQSSNVSETNDLFIGR